MENGKSSQSSGSQFSIGGLPFRTPRRYGRSLVIATLFLLMFGTFRQFPGASTVYELWYVVVFFFLAGPYVYLKASKGLRLSSFEIYVLLIVLIVPVLSGVMAWKVFGQPISYGILAQRNVILSAASLALIYAVKYRGVSLRDVEQALVILVWGTLSLYVAVMLFVDPASFAAIAPGFVTGGTVEKSEFKFDNSFIVFGFFYYGLAAIRRRSRLDSFLAIILIMYVLIGVGGRSMLISILLAFIYFVFKWSSSTRLVVTIPKLLVTGFLLLTAAYLSDPEYILRLSVRFYDALTVLLTGQPSNDASANARIFEIALVLPYVAENWLFGSGDISNQWHGGYEAVLGRHFYPSDIGVIGVLFMYGIVGIVILSLQFLFSWKYAKQIPRDQHTAFSDGIVGFLLYFAIHSVITGRFAYYAETGILFAAMLLCFAFPWRNAVDVKWYWANV